MDKLLHCYCDGDSIAYSAGYTEYPAEMERCCDNYIKDILFATKCDVLFGYVENPVEKQNFRKILATSKPYKSNRTGTKPKWMVEAKYYLHNKYRFEFVTFMESEDMASIEAHKHGLHRSIIACIDKDLHSIPAHFYDYKQKKMFTISEDEADYNLYKQICTGDSVDTCPGIPGCGSVTAEKILDGIPHGHRQFAVAKAYKAKGFGYEYFIEQCRIIRILTHIGEVFTPLTREQFENL